VVINLFVILRLSPKP